MKQRFSGIASACLLLAAVLSAGCTDEKPPAAVKEPPKAGRIFDTQRSALEEAKETAAAAAQRNLQFQERAKETD